MTELNADQSINEEQTKESKSGTLSLRPGVKLRAQLEEAASKSGQSLNQFILSALEDLFADKSDEIVLLEQLSQKLDLITNYMGISHAPSRFLDQASIDAELIARCRPKVR